MSFFFKRRTHVQHEDIAVSGIIMRGVAEKNDKGAKCLVIGQEEKTKVHVL